MNNISQLHEDDLAATEMGLFNSPCFKLSSGLPHINSSKFKELLNMQDITSDSNRTIGEQPKKSAAIKDLIILGNILSNGGEKEFKLSQYGLRKSGINGNKYSTHVIGDAFTILDKFHIFEKGKKKNTFIYPEWVLEFFGESEVEPVQTEAPKKKPTIAKTLLNPPTLREFTEAENKYLSTITKNKKRLDQIKFIIALIETNIGSSKGVMLSERALGERLGCSDTTAHRILKQICSKVIHCTSKHYDEENRIGRKYRLSDSFKMVNTFATIASKCSQNALQTLASELVDSNEGNQ